MSDHVISSFFGKTIFSRVYHVVMCIYMLSFEKFVQGVLGLNRMNTQSFCYLLDLSRVTRAEKRKNNLAVPIKS